MRGCDAVNADYWAGYERGLRRAYHGDKFGTVEEHNLWLYLKSDVDESRRLRGLGYRDGLRVTPRGDGTGAVSGTCDGPLDVELRWLITIDVYP